jgi:hypothetical protein
MERTEKFEQKQVLAEFWQNRAESTPQTAPLAQAKGLSN